MRSGREISLPLERVSITKSLRTPARLGVWSVKLSERQKLLLIFGFPLFFSQSLETTLTGFEFPDTLVHPLSFSSNAAQALA